MGQMLTCCTTAIKSSISLRLFPPALADRVKTNSLCVSFNFTLCVRFFSASIAMKVSIANTMMNWEMNAASGMLVYPPTQLYETLLKDERKDIYNQHMLSILNVGCMRLMCYMLWIVSPMLENSATEMLEICASNAHAANANCFFISNNG